MLSEARSGCWRAPSRNAYSRVLVAHAQHLRVARRVGKYLNRDIVCPRYNKTPREGI